MLVVVEGPDGAGKSTLIQRLRRNSTRYFVVVRAAGYPPTDEHYKRFVPAIFALKHQLMPDSVVCDRFQPISESIYRPIARRAGVFEPNYHKDLSEVDVILYCRPKIQTIQRNLAKEEQMVGVSDTLTELVAAYDDLMDRLTMMGVVQHIVWYDYEGTSAEQVAGFLARKGF